VLQQNPPWKIEFDTSLANFEPVIYEWQELRTPTRWSRWLPLVGVLAAGVVVFLVSVNLSQQSTTEISPSGSTTAPNQNAKDTSRQNCLSAEHAISLARKASEPRYEVDFGGVRYKSMELICSGAASNWLIKWVYSGGVWEPESANQPISGEAVLSR